MYFDIGADDILYSEFTEMCHKAWSQYYFCIDMTTNKDDGKYPTFNESKTTYIESVPKIEPFY